MRDAKQANSWLKCYNYIVNTSEINCTNKWDNKANGLTLLSLSVLNHWCFYLHHSFGWRRHRAAENLREYRHRKLCTNCKINTFLNTWLRHNVILALLFTQSCLCYLPPGSKHLLQTDQTGGGWHPAAAQKDQRADRWETEPWIRDNKHYLPAWVLVSVGKCH